MPNELHERAEERARKLGYASFSEYAQYLLEEDCEQKPAHTLTRREDSISRKVVDEGED